MTDSESQGAPEAQAAGSVGQGAPEAQAAGSEAVVTHNLDGADDATVAPATFADLGAGRGPGPAADLRMLSDVPLDVTVELGRAVLKLRDLLTLAEGSVIELNRSLSAPVDIIVNGKLVARGDVVVVGDEFGVRVTEVLSPGGGA